MESIHAGNQRKYDADAAIKALNAEGVEPARRFRS